jgi:uncharacterized membrane protein
MAEKKELIITDADAAVIAKKLHWGRMTVWATYAGLILMFIVMNLLGKSSNFALLAFQILPLMLFIPGLLKNSHRTYSWLCFVVLMYFVAIIPLLMTRWWMTDWILVTLICVLFVAAMMTSRWVQYWNYYTEKKATLQKKSFSLTTEE